MKAEMPVCEIESKKAPPSRSAVAVATVDADARVSGTMEIIFKTMQDRHSASRREILKVARKKGYTDADVNAVLNYLVTTPTLAGIVVHAVAKPLNDSLTGGESNAQPFDPYAVGEQIVGELQAAEGGSWTGQELQGRYKLTSAVLHRRRKEHRIIYWRDARNDFHYPKWQFTPSGASLPGIQEVLEMFQSQDEWRVMRYFLGKRAQLAGQRPLDLLRQGEVEKVIAHAKIHVEENTW